MERSQAENRQYDHDTVKKDELPLVDNLDAADTASELGNPTVLSVSSPKY